MARARDVGKLTKVVKKILGAVPGARDRDTLLYYYVVQSLGFDTHAPLATILRLIENGTLPNFDTVSRARRLVQAAHPELRGNTWEKRHKHEEEDRRGYAQLSRDEHEANVVGDLFP